jgi:ubiquinone biosynthesis protein
MDKVTGVPLQDIQFSEILQDLLEGARRNNLKVPSEFMLMGKALLTVERLGKNLDPDLEIETELTPYIRRLVTLKYSPKNLTRLLFKRALDWYHWSSELPGHLQTIMEDLETGQLKVRVEQTDQGQMLKNVEAIVGKLTAGLIISALLVSSAMFITFSRMEYQFMGLPVTFILGMAGYLGAAILGMRLVRAVVKSRPPHG